MWGQSGLAEGAAPGVRYAALEQTFGFCTQSWPYLSQTVSSFLRILGNPGSPGRGCREAGLGDLGLCPRSRKHGLQVPAHNSRALWKQGGPLPIILWSNRPLRFSKPHQ